MTDKQLQNFGMHVEDAPQWEIDAVCGMELDPQTTEFHTAYEDTEYYFCGKSCRDHFMVNPTQYSLS